MLSESWLKDSQLSFCQSTHKRQKESEEKVDDDQDLESDDSDHQDVQVEDSLDVEVEDSLDVEVEDSQDVEVEDRPEESEHSCHDPSHVNIEPPNFCSSLCPWSSESLDNNVLSDPVGCIFWMWLITQAEVPWVCSKNNINNLLCFSGAETWSQQNTLNSDVLPQSLCQPVNIKYPKTKVDHPRASPLALSSQLAWLHYLPISDSVICHTCVPQQIWRDCFIFIQDLKAHSCLMGLEIGKMLFAKPRFSVDMRARYITNMCSYYVNSTRSRWWAAEGEAQESKGGNRNCLLKIVQSIFYLSCLGITLRKGRQDEEANLKQLLLLWAEDEVLWKRIEKFFDKHMSMLRMKYYTSWLYKCFLV